MATDSPATYKPIALRARILRWWLTAGIVVGAASSVLTAIHLSILDPGSFAGNEAVLASDDRLQVAAVAELSVFLVTWILWLLWFHRAYRNTAGFEPVTLRFGKGWAVGAWFVPILNLFRPKQIANDVWRLSASAPDHTGSRFSRPVAPIVHWWWAAWLISSVLGSVSARLFDDTPTLAQERVATAVDVFAGLCFVATGVVALLFVRALTDRQIARAVELDVAKGDLARAEADEEERRRRRPAVAIGTLLGAGMLIVGAGLLISGSGRSRPDSSAGAIGGRAVSVFELRPGDCVARLPAQDVRVVGRVPCDERHEAEMLSRLTLEDDAFPGERTLVLRAERRCGIVLEAASPPRRNHPSTYYLHPTRQSWALGDREILCAVVYELPATVGVAAG